jgi:hypothetical protein
MFCTQGLSVAVDQRPYAREGVYYRRYWDRPPHAASFPGRLLVSPEVARALECFGAAIDAGVVKRLVGMLLKFMVQLGPRRGD